MLVPSLFSFIFLGSMFQASFSYPYSHYRHDPFKRSLSGSAILELFDELTSTLLHSLRKEGLGSGPAHSKVVFPVPEDVVMNRSYLPDLGFLTDIAFLFLPRTFPASGMLKLSRDLFESEQCVQFVSCEMTKMAHQHGKYLSWMENFLQDFPFQGDVADRLRQGSVDAIRKFNRKENGNVGNEHVDFVKDEEICTFSCSPVKSLTRGLQILSLLHELVRTVK